MITPEDIESGLQDFVSRYDFIKWLKVRYSVEHGYNDVLELSLSTNRSVRYGMYIPAPKSDNVLEEVIAEIERGFYDLFENDDMCTTFVNGVSLLLLTCANTKEFDAVMFPDRIEIEHERTCVLIIKEETKAINKKYIDYLNYISAANYNYRHIVLSAIDILSLVVDGFLYDIKNKVFTHYGDEIEPNAAGWVVFGD